MILTDTGPLVAIFNARDAQHKRCVKILKDIEEPLITTTPVLTEVFHLLPLGSNGARNLKAFVCGGGISIWNMDGKNVRRALEIMENYEDRPMDFADASLLAAAETIPSYTVFTIDRHEFHSYRVKRGHRHEPLEILE